MKETKILIEQSDRRGRPNSQAVPYSYPAISSGPCSPGSLAHYCVSRLLTATLVVLVIVCGVPNAQEVRDAGRKVVLRSDSSESIKFEGSNVCYFLNVREHPTKRELDLMSVINRTWRRTLGPRDFFYTVTEGNETGFVATNRIEVKMESIGYRKLHFKTLEFFKFLSSSPKTKHCDFALRVDTDSYVNPNALRHVITKHVNAESFLWTGSIWGSGCGSFVHSSVLVSRGFLERSKTLWQPCLAEMKQHGNYTTYEDVAFACCMQKHGFNEPNRTPGFFDHNNWVDISRDRKSVV